ncbi:hypothetical protein J6590_032364 [Homalodisca vitripennis]|nr:hypothetical protein J6590_032364 [Homalodisca vitripennis]
MLLEGLVMSWGSAPVEFLKKIPLGDWDDNEAMSIDDEETCAPGSEEGLKASDGRILGD